MFDQKYLLLISQVLLIAGALNWGLVALNGADLVRMITGGGAFERYIKFLVAAAGLFAAYNLAVSLLPAKNAA